MRDSPLPESLSTIHAVVLAHAKPACALAGPMTLAKRVCNCRSGLHFRRNQSPARTIRPPSPIQYPQKPSGAHSNPIGRSPRPSQTPATYFKRPYRNCPGRRSCHRTPSSRRDSPDRDLTFLRTYPRRGCRSMPVQGGDVQDNPAYCNLASNSSSIVAQCATEPGRASLE